MGRRVGNASADLPRIFARFLRRTRHEPRYGAGAARVRYREAGCEHLWRDHQRQKRAGKWHGQGRLSLDHVVTRRVLDSTLTEVSGSAARQFEMHHMTGGRP